jgi:hypothetical protein
MSRHFRIRIQSSCLTAPFFPGLQGSRAFIAREHSHLATASAAAASQSRALRTHGHRPRAATAGQEMEQGAKPALGWAARDATGVLSPYSFSRRCVTCICASAPFCPPCVTFIIIILKPVFAPLSTLLLCSHVSVVLLRTEVRVGIFLEMRWFLCPYFFFQM